MFDRFAEYTKISNELSKTFESILPHNHKARVKHLLGLFTRQYTDIQIRSHVS
jgi:hypothetical protein